MLTNLSLILDKKSCSPTLIKEQGYSQSQAQASINLTSLLVYTAYFFTLSYHVLTSSVI